MADARVKKLCVLCEAFVSLRFAFPFCGNLRDLREKTCFDMMYTLHAENEKDSEIKFETTQQIRTNVYPNVTLNMLIVNE